MEFDKQKIVDLFFAESEEGLQVMESNAIELESNPANLLLLDEIFRAAHTIKGNSTALQYQGLSGFAHSLEGLLDLLRAKRIEICPDLISLILKAVDVLRELLPGACNGNDELSEQHLQLKIQIEGYANSAPAQTGSEEPVAISPTMQKHEQRNDRTLRVDVTKLDTMLNITGEILVAQGRVRRLAQQLGSNAAREFLDAHEEMDQLYKDLQELVMGVRLVPVAPLFQQLARTVRDLAKSQNKLAQLRINGAEIEVDTRVLEMLRDPLMHMIRNAVDHGIESPDVRREKGKPAFGIIELSAYHNSGNLFIRLSDDGGGINRKKLLAKARSLGVVGDQEALSDQEIVRLVLCAGLSTADQVTEISGRGVGMDVVRANIESLRGRIEITSEEGKGCTIIIRLPLTLSIIDGLSVTVAGEVFLIPLEPVSECIKLDRNEVSAEKYGVINLRGKPLPYVRLRDVLKLRGEAESKEHIVVLNHEFGCVGLAVDQLLGESQAIIKPLHRMFEQIPELSASTILPDGRVALILDVNSLIRDVISNHGSMN